MNSAILSTKITRLYNKISVFLLLLCLPYLAYAEDIDVSDPLDRTLYTVLKMMTGPTASIVGAIALVATGYLFLRGRIDVMRLLAIIAGLGLIFGAPHLVNLLQQSVG